METPAQMNVKVKTKTGRKSKGEQQMTSELVGVSKRKYSGPVKGSEEAKKQMAKVREAQYARHGFIKQPA